MARRIPVSTVADLPESDNSDYGLDSAMPVHVGGRVEDHAGLVLIKITCQGESPLLMNAMSQQQLLDIWYGRKQPKTAQRREPKEEARAKLHCLPDGRPWLPPKCLYATLVNAGQFIRLDGKRQISTAQKTVLPAMLTLISTEILLTKRGSDESADWDTDLQQGRNPNGGQAVCIIRPRFDNWQFKFEVEVDQTLMPLTMARELVDVAGKRVGLLEFAPRHRGTFGRFNVTQWEVCDNH